MNRIFNKHVKALCVSVCVRACHRGWCTYQRQEGVADAESRLWGEVLIRDKVDPELVAFRSVSCRRRLRATPAAQDGLLGQILHLHVVVPGETTAKREIERRWHRENISEPWRHPEPCFVFALQDKTPLYVFNHYLQPSSYLVLQSHPLGCSAALLKDCIHQ